jgi:hypothetical protein
MATIWASRRLIRDDAPRSNVWTCRISSPSVRAVYKTAHAEHGPRLLTGRDPCENSNARFVRTPFGSGFVAVIGQPANEIFSPDSGL